MSASTIRSGGCARNASEGRAFAVVTTHALADGAVWETNRPIEISFDAAVDLGTATAETVQIHSLLTGAFAVGTFSLKNGSRDRTLVFQPRCPIDPGGTDAGIRSHCGAL